MGEVMINDYTKRLKPWFHLTVEETEEILNYLRSFQH